MPLRSTLPAALLETVLSGIAALILAGANDDTAAARQAAREMLADYHPETAAELSLAATIISCGLRSLAMLVQSAAKDMPVPLALRLHTSATGLCREAAKAQRQLTLLQKARKQTCPEERAQIQPDPEPVQIQPQAAPASTATPQNPPRPLGPIAQFAKERGLTWSKAYKERGRERRLAARAQREAAKSAAAASNPTTSIADQPQPISA